MLMKVPCTETNAIQVIKLRKQGLICNPYPEIAQLAVTRDLNPVERIVVKCP